MEKINTTLENIFPITSAVVFLHAHPDDESFLSAGLIDQLVRILKRNVKMVYCAAAVVQGENKTMIRQEEAMKACALLGIQSPLFLGFCEPKYTGSDAKPLVLQTIERVSDGLWEALEREGIQPPINLISYDKNGGYGNKDHTVVHAAGRYLQKEYKEGVKLFEITINRDHMHQWISDAQKRFSIESLPQLSYWSEEFGLPEKEIQFYYQLTVRQIGLKRKALAAHESQVVPELFPLTLGREDFARVFGHEFIHVP